MLGVSQHDKMTFFLLKWIFNAIKRIDKDGQAYVIEGDLVNQLKQNPELMNALGYETEK